MIELSEATAIALHAMTYIAGKNEVVSLKEIAERFDVSEHHLSKVLQRLVKAGYLVSTKGPKGGFRIAGECENASFMEIYEIIEGKYIRKSCLFASKTGAKCCCVMGGLLNEINDKFETFMKTHKINENVF